MLKPLKPVVQAVQLFLKGATGKDRQVNQQLSDQLLKVQVAYDQLQQKCDRLQTECTQLQRDYKRLQTQNIHLTEQLQDKQEELEEFVNFADTDAQFLTEENQDLQLRLLRSEEENSELQNRNGSLLGKVAVLENQLTLRTYQPGTHSDAASDAAITETVADEETDGAIASSVDLSNVSLALVGGHETSYREVSSELEQYGLKRCVHIPPHSIENNSRQQIKEKIGSCDLVLIITSYVDHPLSKCVKQLKAAQMLAGECLRVSCHGKSGLVREVLNYFEDVSKDFVIGL